MKTEFQGVCSKNWLWALFYSFPWFILTAFATSRAIIEESEIKFVDQFMSTGKQLSLKKSEITAVNRMWFGAIKITHSDRSVVNPLYFSETSVSGLSESEVVMLLKKHNYHITN
jgi:hypothetical protein